MGCMCMRRLLKCMRQGERESSETRVRIGECECGNACGGEQLVWGAE